MRACQLNGTEWWSGARSIFISLFYARVAAGVIIYRASDNWQRFFSSFFLPPPPSYEHLRSGLKLYSWPPRLRISTLAECSQASVNYGVCHGPEWGKGEKKKSERKEEISRHSRWGRGFGSRVRQNKILRNWTAFMSCDLKVIDLRFLLQTGLDFSY